MQVICRVFLIRLTTAMLFVQAICPINVFGCECSKPNREESHVGIQKSACCSSDHASKSESAESGCCCSSRSKQVASTKKSAKKTANLIRQIQAPQCCHENAANLLPCCCANSFAPAIPAGSKQLNETVLNHAFLSHPDFCSLSIQKNRPACLNACAPPATTPQNFAQILLCVSLV